MQRECAEHIAFQLWMLRRNRKASNAEILKAIQDMPPGYEPGARLRGEDIRGDTEADQAAFRLEAERRLVPNERALERLTRSEAHAVRMYQKLMAEYRAMQQQDHDDEEAGKQWIEVRKAEE
jgi:hypothetical protein